MEEYILNLLNTKPFRAYSNVVCYRKNGYQYDISYNDRERTINFLIITEDHYMQHRKIFDDPRFVAKVTWRIEDWNKYFETCAIEAFKKFVEEDCSQAGGMDSLLDE